MHPQKDVSYPGGTLGVYLWLELHSHLICRSRVLCLGNFIPQFETSNFTPGYKTSYPGMLVRNRSEAGLSHGTKSQFWYIWEGRGMEYIGKFYCHLLYSLQNFVCFVFLGIFCGHLLHFSLFGILYLDKFVNSDLRWLWHYAKCVAIPIMRQQIQNIIYC
jgi:hypothetical protein